MEYALGSLVEFLSFESKKTVFPFYLILTISSANRMKTIDNRRAQSKF